MAVISSALDMLGSVTSARFRQLGFSLVDQSLSVGGAFLINVSLARTQTREAYGIFALCYSVFTFLAGLHNAMIVETYTVYGSGRYHLEFPSYTRLLWRTNLTLVAALAFFLTASWQSWNWIAQSHISSAGLGVALFSGMPLSALFLRRTFYLRRRPDLAARFSLIFFSICALLLWLTLRTNAMNGLYAFLDIGLAWGLAALIMTRELPQREAARNFTDIHPEYWKEHWKDAR